MVTELPGIEKKLFNILFAKKVIKCQIGMSLLGQASYMDLSGVIAITKH